MLTNFPRTFKFGSAIEDMQVGCLWQGEYLLSVSLSGYINYLDRENPDTPKRVIMVCIILILTWYMYKIEIFTYLSQCL
jgi:hypothetical protein